MAERWKKRLLDALPTLRALGQWLVLSGLTGLACGGAGAAFTWCVARAAALRGAGRQGDAVPWGGAVR